MMVERMCRIMNELKSLRLKSHLTQKEAADRIGVSLRSYVSYENEVSRIGTPKYRFLLSEMSELSRLDEEHGVLMVDEIREAVSRARFRQIWGKDMPDGLPLE